MKKTVALSCLVGLFLFSCETCPAVTCKVINVFTTQTGQVVAKVSCEDYIGEPGTLIKVRKAKKEPQIEGC